MTALKNRVYALLVQKKEDVRKANIFSEKGQKALLGLDLAPRETIIGKKCNGIFR